MNRKEERTAASQNSTPRRTESKKATLRKGIPCWKPMLDLIVVLVAIPLWLPVALLISLWITLVSRGGVFYKQARVGYRGKTFTLYKFRTMKAGASTDSHAQYLHQLIESDAPMTKMDGSDSRVILGGKLIRAAGLDELPQLLNVILGDMSIVGPRPCTPGEMEKFKPCYRKRFAGLPGLTGSWQVNGKNKTSFRRMVALDIRYLQTVSLWKDLLIMARTAPALASQIAELRKAGLEEKAAMGRVTTPRFPVHKPLLSRKPAFRDREKAPTTATAAFEFIRSHTQRLTELPSGHTEPVSIRPHDN